MRLSSFIAAAALFCTAAIPAYADKLDDIIASGKLRCAVVLDFPPMGSRDASNNPIPPNVTPPIPITTNNSKMLPRQTTPKTA